ncbi:MAG: chromosome segregation protein SMC [Deltaproteobacteria bacterium HGW-Deltaproteobacteria-9]|nr:MAG: chromosome segregation protein SMC [Deltaproteobacteria bacterium HGW-Deltaproteobacteria-9]
MRILGVRFKNLNSLVGEWQVDFTHPDYSSEGIFAITGPTGSGKTTIMDAICLGLYGRTPRLDKVTKSSNEIMSRQTGECFAEVTFETQKGHYRCHWSQHRAKRRPEGELQQAKHEIADADSETVLESKINQVGEFIEKATGMDFERFTRSMLLAQGGFTVFLHAPPNERAPILEQITGTEIYSRISMKVHERRTGENNRLEMLQAELKGIQVLSEDEERDLGTSVQENQAREALLAGKLDEMNKALAWIEGIFSLEKELVELDIKQQDFEQRRQEFAPESKKLERSMKALGLEGDYSGVAALRAQQDHETKELDGAIITLPEKDKTAIVARDARQAAESLLNEARARQASAAQVIKRVRDLDARLGEQKRQLDEKMKAIGEIETQGKSYKSHITHSEQTLKNAHDALKAVHEYRTKHAADASLLANLNAIEKGFALLRDSETKHRKAREGLSAAAGKKESAFAACSKTEAGHEKLRREFEKRQGELKGLTDEITAILKGRDISQWRSETDTLRDRERLLSQTGETIEGIDKTHKALDGLQTRIDASRIGNAKLSDEIKSSTDKKALLEKDIVTLETRVSLLSRIRDLDEERKRLEDGKPCPLCGATDHPYAQGNVPVLSEAEAELKKTKNEFKNISQVLSKLEAGQVQTTAEIQHAEKDMEEKKATLDTDEKRCADALVKLNIEVSPEDRSGKVREAIAGVQAKTTETSGIISVAEEKGRKEKTAQTALEKIRETFDNAGKTLQDARHKLETAVLEHARLIKDVDAQAEETRKIRTAVLKDVEPYGISDTPLDGLDTILKDLTKRRDTWQAKDDEKSAHKKQIDELKADIEKHNALSSALEKDLETRRKNCDDLKIEYDSFSSSRRELFGEKNTDQEEKRLAEAMDKAGEAFEKAREEYGEIEKEITALKEKIDSLKEKTGKRAKELAQTEQNLTERIKKTGFEDEADYLSSRLSEEEREILADKERALIKGKTELDARRKDKSETLASEREKKLTDQSSETLKENIIAWNTDLKQVRLDIGGILKSLSENEKLKEKQRERIMNIDAQKKECARWEDLHHLIGSADGKKFRNFAQGLTFEMMIAHANRQLGKMTDRYLLVRDVSQPLELNVIDNYQAGEIRSTKNLSGGESFIVSLALALGLSQMASRNVRVDSLFLDEGFGTLDEDALETALETLAGLQQDGKLIGVISHVAALKERIGAQIQVIPEAGGRSSLSGPGCRRI